jgi:hypothetical protein
MPKVILRSIDPSKKKYFTARVNIYGEDKKTVAKKINITQDFHYYLGESKDDLWRIRFDENKTSHFIEWKEENGEPKTEYDKKKKACAEFIGKHEQVRTLFGEPNANLRGEALYTLEWEGLKNTFVADNNDKKFEVYAKMRNMIPNEKRDCAFYYGINATGLKHSELINRLGDFESGILHNTKVKEGEMISTRDHFLTLYGKDVMHEVKLLTEKCKKYNLLTKNEKGFWFNEEFIGTTDANIYEYINANEGVKSLLKRECAKKENPVEDDMEEEVKTNMAKPTGAEPKEDWQKIKADKMASEEEILKARKADIDAVNLQELKDKAKSLGVKHYQVLGKEKLLAAIAEKESVAA